MQLISTGKFSPEQFTFGKSSFIPAVLLEKTCNKSYILDVTILQILRIPLYFQERKMWVISNLYSLTAHFERNTEKKIQQVQEELFHFSNTESSENTGNGISIIKNKSFDLCCQTHG